MLSPSLTVIAAFMLTSLSVGGLMMAAFYPRISKAGLFEQRFAGIAALKVREQSASIDNNSRKQSVEATLRELEERQKARAKKGRRPTLVGRMRQGGLNWTKRTYYLVCVATGLASYAVPLVFGLGNSTALGFGVAAGLLLPHIYVSARRKGRFKRFTAEFPNAVDVIVRGLKAGLPMADCMKIIASEAQEPVKSEFRTVVADQTLGLPMDEAVQRLSERVPISEANFFAIVIAIQSRTGGSLAEALSNLSRVLRERKKMQAKIRAMSAEAKASGGIIGVLPVIVAGLVYLTSPEYISLLFTALIGNIVLAACGLWMTIGILVMRKMINFDF
ncbi:type II secretion system F family protein [Mesorhizobium sp.]|uniref:type II secretion system F family protein n=1 Tax=Mesorhizobium sp. TaxID=1871066 RepID=UPI00122AC67B|nr:type II secretion system F family protein [Mesorhizobium sp.]TIS55696.1 MAG: type II secretion system F family protein [Mesorhizobium sp.]TIS86818.1 MAG: type II secretion system F family protein [Mesorhizobium sp.]